jgi:hypothetical protein
LTKDCHIHEIYTLFLLQLTFLIYSEIDLLIGSPNRPSRGNSETSELALNAIKKALQKRQGFNVVPLGLEPRTT